MEIALSIYTRIVEGKIHYEKTALLEIEFSSTMDAPEMFVVISVDEKILLMKQFSAQTTEFKHKIPEPPSDSKEIIEHELRIEVRGRPTGAMLHIHNICIEGLDMRLTMEDSGECQLDGEPAVPSEYMGQVGYQSLKFATPIYPWLFANERKDTYYYPH
jgi:hypothetical protein